MQQYALISCLLFRCQTRVILAFASVQAAAMFHLSGMLQALSL